MTFLASTKVEFDVGFSSNHSVLLNLVDHFDVFPYNESRHSIILKEWISFLD